MVTGVIANGAEKAGVVVLPPVGIVIATAFATWVQPVCVVFTYMVYI